MRNQPHQLDSSRDGELSEAPEDRESFSNWLMESLRPPPPPASDALESEEEPVVASAGDDGADALLAQAPSDVVSRDEAHDPTPVAVASSVLVDEHFTAGSEEEEAFATERDEEDPSAGVVPVVPAPGDESPPGEAWNDEKAPDLQAAGAEQVFDEPLAPIEELAADTSATFEPQFLSGDGLDAPVDDGGADDTAVLGTFVTPRRRLTALPLLLVLLLLVFLGGRWLLRERAGTANHTPPAPKVVAVAAVPPVPAPPEAVPVEIAEEEPPASGMSASGSRHRGTPPDVTPEPSPQYGPSVARFPDLPHSVLLQLERAAASADPGSTTD